MTTYFKMLWPNINKLSLVPFNMTTNGIMSDIKKRKIIHDGAIGCSICLFRSVQHNLPTTCILHFTQVSQLEQRMHTSLSIISTVDCIACNLS